ncbi:hypothetical protein TYRP_004243 [Tyrophagus putrescentiae]|nr:hypothetical protein TYRP_004243 [Tyrophagus putrescentiae]
MISKSQPEAPFLHFCTPQSNIVRTSISISISNLAILLFINQIGSVYEAKEQFRQLASVVQQQSLTNRNKEKE